MKNSSTIVTPGHTDRVMQADPESVIASATAIELDELHLLPWFLCAVLCL